MGTPSTAQYRMADRLSGGRLADIISDGRAAGQSFEQIARRLWADFGVEVSQKTLGRWAADLAIDASPAEATA